MDFALPAARPRTADPAAAAASLPFAAATLLLRRSLAAMWLSHAVVLKLMTFGLPGLAAWMATQGFAPVLAGPLVAAEIAGGLLIALGWHGRWASLALQPVLLGALFVHAGNGWVFTSANGGWEYPLFLIAVSLVHVLLGDGPWGLRFGRRA
jgi:putative oxidoreductase